jgi:hypothetical protein
MAVRAPDDRTLYELVQSNARKISELADWYEQHITEALNAAYLQGAADARKALTNHDPKVPDREEAAR